MRKWFWRTGKTGAIVTENHQIAGGLGTAVALLLSAHHPIPMEMVGINDRFSKSALRIGSCAITD